MKKIFMVLMMIVVSEAALAATEEEQLMDELSAAQAATSEPAQVAPEATNTEASDSEATPPPAPATPPEFANEEQPSAQPETVELEEVPSPPPPIVVDETVTSEPVLERPSLKEDSDSKTTRDVGAKSEQARSISVGIRYPIGPNSADVTLNTVAGFSMKSDYNRSLEIFGQYREGNLAIEVAMSLDDERSHELFFYGSSLGKMTVSGPSWIITGKYYVPLTVYDVHPYVGIGFKQMQVSGYYGMGGVPFETKGDGWHAIGVLGAEFPVWKNYSVIAEYRLNSTDLATEIPTAGKVSITTGAQLLLGVSAAF